LRSLSTLVGSQCSWTTQTRRSGSASRHRCRRRW
jgi:hypothetical protein